MLQATFADGGHELTGLSPHDLGGFDQAALRVVPAAYLDQSVLDHHRRQFGVEFAQDAPPLAGAPFVDLSTLFPLPNDCYLD